MKSFLRGSLRRWIIIGSGTFAANWAYRNRNTLLARFGRTPPITPDTTRPVGDRFVGPTADREPSPFEAAMAAEAAPLTPSVSAHEEEAISHVRINAS